MARRPSRDMEGLPIVPDDGGEFWPAADRASAAIREPQPVAKRPKPASRKPQPVAKRPSIRAPPEPQPATSVLVGLPIIPEEALAVDTAVGVGEGVASAGALGADVGAALALDVGEGLASAGALEATVAALGIAASAARAPEIASSSQTAPPRSLNLVDPRWRDDAAKMEVAVWQWTRSSDVVWARAVDCILGAKLKKHRPKVFTDCEGIGAPLEAFRILECVGALGPYLHLASGEIDPEARAWFLKHHRWPDRLFGDMLGRTWPDGLHEDLFTNQPREIPRGADIYICGFPCCPFSLRKGHSKLFEEEKAPHNNFIACICVLSK